MSESDDLLLELVPAEAAERKLDLLSAPIVPAMPVGRPAAQGAWMITFTDLVALLLTFMVMLFAMSKVELRKWQNLVDLFGQQLDSVREEAAAQPQNALDIARVDNRPAADLDYLSALLAQNLAAQPLLAGAILQRVEDRLVIALPGELLFAPGSTALAPSAKATLDALVLQLRPLGNRLEVLGHADPRPPARGVASNWQLSLSRAARVVTAMQALGYPGNIAARGLGDSRFETLSPLLAPARRLALGRRVELVIHGDGGEAPP